MFTGLIEGTGTLLRIDRHGPDAGMVIRADYPVEDLRIGESIAVDGACLTVTSFQGNSFTADVSAETLGRTTLGRKPSGCRLNLERALRVGDRLGGHIVSGHVDGLGTLHERRDEGRSLRLFFGVPPELAKYIIAKGSVAINGISLTINGTGEGRFDVNIVPHTALETTIRDLRNGDTVNVETDVIGKYVEKLLGAWTTERPGDRRSTGIDAEYLQKHGFL
jgi:riboflavin synthase